MTPATPAATRVLFVCTGNICRSPTAEGVVRHLAEAAGLDGALELESAGTTRWHTGEPPDPRAVEAAARRGYDLSRLRARQVEPADFERFDLILAMDRSHHEHLRRMCPAGARGRLRMFLEYAPAAGRREVPDPYYGADKGFDEMMDLVEAGARGLIETITAERRAQA